VGPNPKLKSKARIQSSNPKLKSKAHIQSPNSKPKFKAQIQSPNPKLESKARIQSPNSKPKFKAHIQSSHPKLTFEGVVYPRCRPHSGQHILALQIGSRQPREQTRKNKRLRAQKIITGQGFHKSDGTMMLLEWAKKKWGIHSCKEKVGNS
jgi:hypothetical protein